MPQNPYLWRSPLEPESRAAVPRPGLAALSALASTHDSVLLLGAPRVGKSTEILRLQSSLLAGARRSSPLRVTRLAATLDGLRPAVERALTWSGVLDRRGLSIADMLVGLGPDDVLLIDDVHLLGQSWEHPDPLDGLRAADHDQLFAALAELLSPLRGVRRPRLALAGLGPLRGLDPRLVALPLIAVTLDRLDRAGVQRLVSLGFPELDAQASLLDWVWAEAAGQPALTQELLGRAFDALAGAPLRPELLVKIADTVLLGAEHEVLDRTQRRLDRLGRAARRELPPVAAALRLCRRLRDEGPLPWPADPRQAEVAALLVQLDLAILGEERGLLGPGRLLERRYDTIWCQRELSRFDRPWTEALEAWIRAGRPSGPEAFAGELDALLHTLGASGASLDPDEAAFLEALRAAAAVQSERLRQQAMAERVASEALHQQAALIRDTVASLQARAAQVHAEAAEARADTERLRDMVRDLQDRAAITSAQADVARASAADSVRRAISARNLALLVATLGFVVLIGASWWVAGEVARADAAVRAAATVADGAKLTALEAVKTADLASNTAAQTLSLASALVDALDLDRRQLLLSANLADLRRRRPAEAETVEAGINACPPLQETPPREPLEAYVRWGVGAADTLQCRESVLAQAQAEANRNAWTQAREASELSRAALEQAKKALLLLEAARDAPPASPP